MRLAAGFAARLVFGVALSEWQFSKMVRTACAAAWAARSGVVTRNMATRNRGR
jgi:hypothetical protein